MLDLLSDIDIVVTHVDYSDENWLADFKKAKPGKLDPCRYRQFDTLNYWFRGIEKNMPWFRKIHLVVSRESQLPTWLNRDNPKLHIVYHEDFIPEKLLPTFNTNHIELFLCYIPDLSERFLYFNDDMFCIHQCKKSDFFTDDGLVKMCLQSKHYKVTNQWHHMLDNGVQLLRKYYKNFYGYQSDHSIYVLRKSLFIDFIDKECNTLLDIFSTSRLRTDKDISLHTLREYIALEGYAVPALFKREYVGLKNKVKFPTNSDAQIICFNDTDELTYGFSYVKTKLRLFLDSYLPDKSSFEL